MSNKMHPRSVQFTRVFAGALTICFTSRYIVEHSEIFKWFKKINKYIKKKKEELLYPRSFQQCSTQNPGERD